MRTGDWRPRGVPLCAAAALVSALAAPAPAQEPPAREEAPCCAEDTVVVVEPPLVVGDVPAVASEAQAPPEDALALGAEEGAEADAEVDDPEEALARDLVEEIASAEADAEDPTGEAEEVDALDPAPEAGAAALSLEPAPLLSRDEFHLLAVSQPGALGALSIGTPDGGLLFNPVPMPEGGLWSVRDPRESFGTAETIDYIVTAIESVEARHPGSPRLVIGDISRPDGGRLNRHRSHQAGRDADIGLYLRTGEATTLVKPGKGQLDLARTWTLLRSFVVETDVERVFLDRSLQRLLYAHALESGEDKAWLDDLFGRRDGGKNAIIQHERRHQDHMHVRFYNPDAQERGRVAYPALVQLGLLPGPTVNHRVRSGETLSHLARRYGVSASAIRRANGLRGSSLRAGRKYVIPVRKAPVEAAAVVVPPRRLPPAALVQELPADTGAPAAPEAEPDQLDAGPPRP